MAREMPVMSTLDRACPTFSSVSSSSPDTAAFSTAALLRRLLHLDRNTRS